MLIRKVDFRINLISFHLTVDVKGALQFSKFCFSTIFKIYLRNTLVNMLMSTKFCIFEFLLSIWNWYIEMFPLQIIYLLKVFFKYTLGCHKFKALNIVQAGLNILNNYKHFLKTWSLHLVILTINHFIGSYLCRTFFNCAKCFLNKCFVLKTE